MAAEDVAVSKPIGDRQETFERLFKQPTIQAMLDMQWQDFQDFVGYVFTCAGFTVEPVALRYYPAGPGVDFNLYHGPVKGKPVARLEVRKYAPTNHLNFADVARFLGVLELAQGVPGYLVTTSSFNGPAQEAAKQANGRVRLINGKTLLRYIAYIDGSRVQGHYGTVPVAPALPIAPFVLENADRITQWAFGTQRDTRILAISNTKGGVAKTTTALNVGFALASLKHQRVLMVDLDGQGSLTSALPPPALPVAQPSAPARRGRGATAQQPEVLPTDTRSIADYFLGRVQLGVVIRPTRFEGLWLAPAHADLHLIHFGGAERTQAELTFVMDLRTREMRDEQGNLLRPFDWIVIDTPAGSTFYGRAAAAAADHIVIPAYAEAFANNGARHTLELIQTMNALMRDTDAWQKRVLGCLFTRWKSGPNATESAAKVRVAMQQYGIHTFSQAIPADDKIETAHRGTMAGKPLGIFRLAPQMGQAAQAYDKFVEEMIQYANDCEASH